MVRGRGNATVLSSMIRPGRAAITQMRFGQVGRLLEIVRYQQHGRPVRRPEILHDRPQFLACELIERAERLVQHEKLRFMNQRAAQ